ncbi:uncharacterized protein EV154DRAFT_555272 [Mucor mucedo]|uniref:uncharacterized protein n=1 Tax=Mucor mucedo TaxID=29922 RepID=UPI00221FC4FC|nr:uncharacterized protein EV154DRAFT_555272 [Mucor mucedo]KAI7880817.1 hypothetical protein EV154DRAFT_555272 [Mucor mucedo]
MVAVVKRGLPHGTNSTHFVLSVEEISVLQNNLGLHNEARSSGLFINAAIHELLSLYHTVLLLKDQHDEAMSNSVNEKSDRKPLKVKLHNLYEAADPFDSKIIDILIKLINKLFENILIYEEVKVFELKTDYLDIVLSPISHDLQKKPMYRWLNRATGFSNDKHPDGGSCIITRIRISCSTGFCEVKAS